MDDNKMDDKLPKDYLKIAAAVSRESGAPLDDILHSAIAKREEVQGKTTNDDGKYTVLCLDKFEGEDFVYNTYASAETALSDARRLTDEAKRSASHHSVATVFLAYNPQGGYIGGDTWVGD